jgi:hypothetical protein
MEYGTLKEYMSTSLYNASRDRDRLVRRAFPHCLLN